MNKKQKTKSIKTTLSLVFVSLSIVILLISGTVQIAAYYQTQQETIASKQNFIASDVKKEVENFIQTKLMVMQVTGSSVSLVDGAEEKLIILLEGIISIKSAFRNAVLLDGSGKLITGSSRFSQVVLTQFLALIPPDLIDNIKTNDHYISKIYIDEMTTEPMIIIATANKSALGDLQSVLVCEITLKFMWDLMANLSVGKSGYAYVVDRSGTMIAFRDPEPVLKKENVSHIKPVEDFLNNVPVSSTSNTRIYKGFLGANVVGRHVPLNTPDWAVIIELPVEEAFREVLKNIIITIIITLFMALISGFVGLYLAHRLASPLIDLTTTVSRITEGEKDIQARIAGSKEVVTLAKAFNSMTNQIRDKVNGFISMNNLLTEIITKAKDMIINLNTAAREIEAGSQTQTSSSQENASAIREVSATLGELSITAKQITKNISELTFSSEETVKLLKMSENQLLDTVTQLEDVGIISKNNAEQIGELGKRSTIINEMVELIKQIANKTNILSINASIEASRLEKKNSGFSVVASEIRLLSKETIESAKKVEAAAKDIRSLLNLVITSSKNLSIKVMGSGNNVKSVFDNVQQSVTCINDNYAFTQRIDASIKQQEQGSVQAAETMRQMAENARESVKMAQETLAAIKNIVTPSQNSIRKNKNNLITVIIYN